MDAKSGISCMHVHAALLYPSHGNPRAVATKGDIAPTPSWDPSSIAIVDEEVLDVVTVETDVEEVPDTPTRGRSTDNRDVIRDMMQKIETVYLQILKKSMTSINILIGTTQLSEHACSAS
ncbi:unnamed protein product [Strongylus vulgaris]|uniref:Uncharacterized protein n=1 Tax=Strongylus vulgaris TaxID=40348 RepID=A0A3P7KAW3_STRVU|nr:unnamed protein product [Strongylus vulgaris]